MTTTTTTVKQTSRAARIWLENKQALESAGFSAGARYTLTLSAGTATLTLDAEGKGRVSSCSRGGAVRPIIDLHNAAIAAAFVPGSVVTATYSPGSIVITTNN